MPQRGQRKHHRGQSCPKNVATGQTQRQTQTNIGLRPEEQTFVLSRAIHAARHLLRASSATHRRRGQCMPRDIFFARQARFASLAHISGGTKISWRLGASLARHHQRLTSRGIEPRSAVDQVVDELSIFLARASIKNICATLFPEAKDKRNKQAHSLG